MKHNYQALLVIGATLLAVVAALPAGSAPKATGRNRSAALPATLPYLVAATSSAGTAAYTSTREADARALLAATTTGEEAEAPGPADWSFTVWTPGENNQTLEAWSRPGLVRATAPTPAPRPRRFPGLADLLQRISKRRPQPVFEAQALFAGTPPPEPSSASHLGPKRSPEELGILFSQHHSVYHGRIVRLLAAGVEHWPGLPRDQYRPMPFALYLFQVLEPFKTGGNARAPAFMLLRWHVPDPRSLHRQYPRLPQPGEEIVAGITFCDWAEKQGERVIYHYTGQHRLCRESMSNMGPLLLRVVNGMTAPWEGDWSPEGDPWVGDPRNPGGMIKNDFIPLYGQRWAGLAQIFRWMRIPGPKGYRFVRENPEWFQEQVRLIRRPGR